MFPATRSKTGISGMDEILHGGLIAGRLYLLDGNPGAGKTTFALQYLLEGVRLGEKCLYITLSETRQELEAGARSHGWSLEGIEIVELAADYAGWQADEQLTMYAPAEVELGEATGRILDVIERSNPSRLVFDSLSEMRLLAQSSLRYRRQILALKQFFIGRDTTVILLDDRTGEGPDMQLHSIAHGVIALDSYTPTYGRVRRQLSVLKFRGSDFMSGFHDFSVCRGGVVVFPRLVAANHAAGFDSGLTLSGVPDMDALVGGGFDRGTSTLLVGPPGSGKSTIALQYAYAAVQRGEHAAIFMFDETKTAMQVRCAGLGMRLREGQGPGRMMIRQVDPVSISPGEFAACVRQCVEAGGASVIVIDSLNGYLNAMPSHQSLTAQLHELLSYLNNQGVGTFLVVAQTGMIGANMNSPVDASYLADSIVALRYFEHQGTVKKAISVLKKRTGRHEVSIRELWFDGQGVHLSGPLMELRGILTGVPAEAGAAFPA